MPGLPETGLKRTAGAVAHPAWGACDPFSKLPAAYHWRLSPLSPPGPWGRLYGVMLSYLGSWLCHLQAPHSTTEKKVLPACQVSSVLQ